MLKLDYVTIHYKVYMVSAQTLTWHGLSLISA